jgi:hypothetical protein
MDISTTTQPAQRPPFIEAPLPDTDRTGYLQNFYGGLVREDLVPPRARLEHQTVEAMIAVAAQLNAQMIEIKARAMADVDAFLDILAAQYHARRSGRRGGIEITSYDGLKRVQLSVADSVEFGPEISTAKDLIDECIKNWSSGANNNLRTLVDTAFKPGRTGKIATDRIMGLRRLKIEDATWARAMMAIDDAMRVAASRTYLRFYTRATTDATWVQIVLDFAGV